MSVIGLSDLVFCAVNRLVASFIGNEGATAQTDANNSTVNKAVISFFFISYSSFLFFVSFVSMILCYSIMIINEGYNFG